MQRHGLRHYSTFTCTFLLVFAAGVMMFGCGDAVQKADKPAVTKDSPDSNVRSSASGDSPTVISDSSGDSGTTTFTPQSDSTIFTHRFRVNTSIGPFSGVLYGKDAPKTVKNFMDLARKQHFNSLPFHRIAANFVIQTGNPNTRRRSSWRTYIDTASEISEERLLEWQQGGESSFEAPFEDEIDTNRISVQRGYRRGTLAMANRGPNSNGSQFFICLRDLPELPPRYSIFGHVTDGFDIIDSIASAPIRPLRSEYDGFPLDPVHIRWVTVY